MSAAGGVVLDAWTGLLFDGFAKAGVVDVVVSPGSRSTPFVLAAHRDGRFRLHDVLDERSAAFFALGLARAGGKVPLLLCTSGTAAAHYFPAIIEASQSELALIVLTADRPLELQACSASQTIDQAKLFGSHVRAYFDAGLAEPMEGVLRFASRLPARVVSVARGASPGPVHVDVRARKPLEPASPTTAEDRALCALAAAIRSEPDPIYGQTFERASDSILARVVSELRLAERPIVVAGPLASRSETLSQAVADFCLALGAPIAAETTSQLRHVRRDERRWKSFDAFDLAARAGALAGATEPDAIVQLGGTPTSASYDAIAGASSARRYVLGARGWPDPQHAARAVVHGDLEDQLRRLAPLLGAPRVSMSGFVDRIGALNETCWSVVSRELESAPQLAEPLAISLALRSLPEGATLAVGNSLAVREVDWYVPGLGRNVEVCSQRGASGIDGSIAGAIGAACATERPLLALLGDVTALHDVGSFALAARVRCPLVLIVLNNGGGRIFDDLPIAATATHEELAHFTTPHAHSLRAIATAFELRAVEARDARGLSVALAAAWEADGVTLIEAIVDPESARRIRASVCAQIAREVAR